jgi:hypothetical protein
VLTGQARSCKWAVPGDLPGGLWRRTRENQRTPPLHRVGAATTRQRTPEATQRQTSSTGRASGRSPALRDPLRLSTDLAAQDPYWRRPGQFADARHSRFPGRDLQFAEPHNSGYSVSPKVNQKWAPSSGRSIVTPGTTSAGRTVKRRDGNKPGPGRPGRRLARAPAPPGAGEACPADAGPTRPVHRP